MESAGPGPCMAQVPLALFLEPTWMQMYIHTGSLYALSMTHLDAGDTVCLDGQGMLILSLCKDTYQTLGLVGRPCRFSHGASGRMGDRRSGAVSRYVVELPLRDPSFVPGKRGYERAKACLQAWDERRASSSGSTSTWPMLMVWTPPSTLTASDKPRIWAPIEHAALLRSSAALRFLPMDIAIQTIDDVVVPTGTIDLHEDENEAFEKVWDHVEWAGIMAWHSPRIRTFDRCDPYVALYRVPTPHTPSCCTHFRLRGFLPTLLLQQLVAMVWQNSASSFSASTPWAILSLSGFRDTPIAWRTKYPGLGLALGSGSSLMQPAPDDGYTAGQRAKKVRRKGHIRRGESEHGFMQSGENGWHLLFFPPSSDAQGAIAFLESMEIDTRM